VVSTITQYFFGVLLLLSSFGVLAFKNPVHACLCFLLTLMTLGALYLELSAEFIAVLQVLVYAGAILVIFMFVIILFQDAHEHIEQFRAKSPPTLMLGAAFFMVLAFLLLGQRLLGLPERDSPLPSGFGTVESLGYQLYLNFFFPFEAVILLFLTSLIGALYIGRRKD